MGIQPLDTCMLKKVYKTVGTSCVKKFQFLLNEGTLFSFQGGHVTPKSGSPPRPNSGGWNPPREQIPDFPPVQPLHPDEEDSGDSSDPESVKRQKL